METDSQRPQWLKTITRAFSGALLGLVVFVIGDLLFWGVMVLLVLIGVAPGFPRDQAGQFLWSQIGLSFVIVAPLGFACGAVSGIYKSFIKD